MTVLLPQPRRVELGRETVTAVDPAEVRDPSIPPQGYRLAISVDGIELAAADDAGAFYGRATLSQLERATAGPGRVPVGVVEDWPDVAVRGVMLDVSRDKVPTVETLEALIDRLAGWKINHVELYMEHTFAYAGHAEVWRDSSAYTTDDIARLDRFCRDRHVELTPNQNCLGHFERWLRHDRYRPLAVAPGGWTDRSGRVRPPTTLDPANPGSLALVRSLLGELVPAFSSGRVHAGLDEPWELPDERFGDYLDFVERLRAAPELEGRELLMWGDIVASHPAELGELPPGVTVCEWGYEADHPFAERAEVLVAQGRPFWLCPGTSSWNSLLGRTTNMVDNCRSAAEVASATGAAGLLVTDWGDNGHLQYLPVSEPGFANAAALSWCLDSNRSLDLADALSDHGFDDDTGDLAEGLLALGDLHRLVRPQVPNASVLVLHLYSPRYRMGEGRTAGLTDADLSRVEGALADARRRVARARPRRPDGAVVKAELATSARLLDLLVRDARARLRAGGRLEDVPGTARRALAREMEEIVEAHRTNWRARNRPGGLADSTARLQALAEAYRTG